MTKEPTNINVTCVFLIAEVNFPDLKFILCTVYDLSLHEFMNVLLDNLFHSDRITDEPKDQLAKEKSD